MSLALGITEMVSILRRPDAQGAGLSPRTRTFGSIENDQRLLLTVGGGRPPNE